MNELLALLFMYVCTVACHIASTSSEHSERETMLGCHAHGATGWSPKPGHTEMMTVCMRVGV